MKKQNKTEQKTNKWIFFILFIIYKLDNFSVLLCYVMVSTEIFSYLIFNYVLQASKLLTALLLVTDANVSIIYEIEAAFSSC